MLTKAKVEVRRPNVTQPLPIAACKKEMPVISEVYI